MLLPPPVVPPPQDQIELIFIEVTPSELLVVNPVHHRVTVRQVLKRHNVTFEGDVIEYKGMTGAIDRGSYAMARGGNVVVCRDVFQSLVKVSNHGVKESEIEGLLTLSGVALSLFGLGATILTYAIFPSLRTGPGRSVINLCVALFVA